jgi:hypothetical protein
MKLVSGFEGRKRAATVADCEKLLSDSARGHPYHLESVSIILLLVKKFRLNEA